MKKRLLAILLASAMAFCAAGCGEKAEETKPVEAIVGTPIVTEEETTSETPEVTEENQEQEEEIVAADIPYIFERQEKDGKKQSYLTGEWKDVNVVNRRPFAIMVPNNKAALPQYGVSKASVIVEAPMEAGSCTRMMCIFEDYDELDHVGPVRSSRLYFIFEAMSFDAIYCNWGLAVPYVADTINSDRVDNISAAVSGITKPSDEAFTRDQARKAAGFATEYTGIMTMDGYAKAVARQGYETNYRSSFIMDFLLASDGNPATYDDKQSAKILRPGGTSSAASGYGAGQPYFEYDESDGLYHRYQFGGAQYDEYNNEKLTCKNVIFKIVQGATLDTKGYLSLIMHGTGNGYVFTNGKVIPCTWSRGDADNEPTYYFDAETGEPIILNQGKTWICEVWGDYADLISYE